MTGNILYFIIRTGLKSYIVKQLFAKWLIILTKVDLFRYICYKLCECVIKHGKMSRKIQFWIFLLNLKFGEKEIKCTHVEGNDRVTDQKVTVDHNKLESQITFHTFTEIDTNIHTTGLLSD